MYWSESLGRIELRITKKQAMQGSHSGPCDDDIEELSKIPAISRQLKKLEPAIVAASLKEYGAWDEIELQNHSDNLRRILWCACCDILENN